MGAMIGYGTGASVGGALGQAGGQYAWEAAGGGPQYSMVPYGRRLNPEMLMARRQALRNMAGPQGGRQYG